MTEQAVSYHAEGDIAVITLERPQVRNAINEAMARTIAGYAPLVTSALKQLVADMIPASGAEAAYRVKRPPDFTGS